MSIRGDLQRPRYFISIAAELASVHPRTLRIYEEEGLLCPQRRNNLRLYSEADIRRVRIIRFLTRRQGVNLAGVKVILQLEALGKIRVYDLNTLKEEASFLASQEVGLRRFLYHDHAHLTDAEWTVITELCGEPWKPAEGGYLPPDGEHRHP